MKQFVFEPKKDMTPAEMAEIWMMINSGVFPVIVNESQLEKSTAMRHFNKVEVAPPKKQGPIMKPIKR